MAARLTSSESLGDDHGGLASRTSHETSGGHPRRAAHSVSNPPPEEAALREMQVLRGAATIKMVASKKTLQSLESVKIEDLPPSERTCIICYNDFGVETPEGIQESPLRLPGCKHVFGDHCIKKWFQDSDSCPYCRDKLHSEPKHHHGNGARAFMNMMRIRGSAANLPEEFVMRVISPASTDPLHAEVTGGRRSPPDVDDEPQRRTRPRRSGSGSRVPVSPLRSGGRRATYMQSSIASSDAYSPQESISRHLFWTSQLPSGHRRMGSTPASNSAADGQPEQFSHQPNARYSIQSISMSRDGLAPREGFPTATDTSLPNILQVNSTEAERNGNIAPQDTPNELGDELSQSGITAHRMPLLDLKTTASSTMARFPWHVIAAGACLGTFILTHDRDTLSKSSYARAFLATLAFELIAWGIWDILIYPRFVSPLRHLPQAPNSHWLLGQGPKILKESNGVPAREWIAEVPNEGLIRYLWFGNRERILLATPKALAEVLVTNNYAFVKPTAVSNTLSRLLGYGVLLAEGEEHKTQRRNLMPAFAFRHTKDLYPVFWKKAQESAQAITASLDSEGTVDTEIGQWASRCTLDIIGLAGMGRDFGAVQDNDNPLVVQYRNVFKPSKQQRYLFLLGQVFPHWFLTRLPIERNEDIHKASATIRAVCRDMIREKKAKRANKEQPDVDILSVALESGHFTDEQLVDQLMTFLAAGHETTASALTWAIYMLCLHPDVQSRLRQEVRERLPPLDGEKSITSIDIDRMPYLNAVCNEVLRYYSPVPQTIREAAYDTTILGTPIPKGTRIAISPWGTNKDRSLWGPDATEFNPERWLPKHEGDRSAASGGASSNYAFLTFLHGPRSCIGQAFAKAEFACVLAAWVGRFAFDLQNEAERDETKVEVKGGITARPAQGMHVKVRLVEGY
ncbi:Cytochrome P450 monooxygenase [Paramyrothecium foliicola]|nr:Cytochrome P450 monooxygenase [Paramyrothecium foliicola]